MTWAAASSEAARARGAFSAGLGVQLSPAPLSTSLEKRHSEYCPCLAVPCPLLQFLVTLVYPVGVGGEHFSSKEPPPAQ